MSDSDDKLSALFEAAVRGQEKLEQDTSDQPGAAAVPGATDAVESGASDSSVAKGSGEIVIEIEDEDSPSPEPSQPANKKAAPKPKKNAADAITEALIQAKQEAVEALEQTQHEAKSMQDRLLRVSADFENFRKRSKQQQETAVKFANESFLRELLPVLDNYDLAVAHVGADDDNPVIKGVQMVQQHLISTLSKFGLSGFSALDQAFDPNMHEAVEQMQTDEHPAGQVVKEYQKGYLLNDRLLRPAMVVVAMPPPAAQPDPAPTSAATSEPGTEEKSAAESTGSDNTQAAGDGGGDGDASAGPDRDNG